MADPRWLNETEQQAWQALLVLINRGFPQLERTFKDHDLLAVHYAILVALSAAPNDTLRLAEVADAASLSQSRLTHRLRTLTDRGIVEISPVAEDGRGKNATLTAAGRSLIESLAPLHVEDVRQLLFDHLTPDETATVAAALSKSASCLCDHENFAANPAEAGAGPTG